jgi:hypothetical protein
VGVRSVVDIDVNSPSMKEFLEAWTKYQTGLAKNPAMWDDVKAVVETVAAVQKDVTKEIDNQAEAVKRLSEEQEKIEKASEASEANRQKSIQKRIDSEKKATRLALEGIKSVGSAALALSLGIGGAVLLAGMAGISAFGNIGSRVASDQRSATGVGLTIGQKKALELNFGQIVDVGSTTSAIADIHSDKSKWGTFAQMGINAEGKSEAQLFTEMILRTKKLWSQGDKSQQYAQANGLLGPFTMGDIRNIDATPESELRRLAGRTAKDSGNLGLSPKAIEEWRTFSRTLTEAKIKIQTTLIEGLAPVARVFDKLTGVISGIIEKLVHNKDFDKWIDKFSKAMEAFGDYLGSEKFITDMKNFAEDFGIVAKKIHDGLVWLNVIPDREKQAAMKQYHAEGGIAGRVRSSAAMVGGQISGAWNRLTGPNSALNAVAARYGISGQFLHNIHGIESNFGRNAGTSSAGALGPFQFMPATARQYGVTDRRDFGQSSDAAGRYFRDLLKQFGGDLRKAAAAYNWGPGNLRRDIRNHGDDWLRYAPKETQSYVARATRGVDVNVRVTSSTGSDTSAQANQAAAG